MLQSIQRLFQLAGEYRREMISSVVFAIGSAAAGILPYFLVGQFVVEMIKPIPNGGRLFTMAILIGLLLIIKTLLFGISTMQSHRAAYRILRNVRLRLAEKLTKLPLGYVLERDSGILKKVMENDVEELERFLAHNIPETISSAAVPMATLIYLAFIDWRMTLAMLAFIPFSFLFYRLMTKGNKDKMGKYYCAVDKMNAVVVEYVNGMKEIKAFNQSESSFFRFREAVSGYRVYVLDWFKSCWPFMSAYYVLIQASIVSVLPVGLCLSLRGTIDPSTFVLFVLVSMGFAVPLIKLAEFADGITLVVNAEQNVQAILREPELKKIDTNDIPQNNTIEFKNVSFSYDGKSNVFNDLSFTAEEGSSVAIIGRSGSGKSTIAKLLCRFWDVKSGEICIGNTNIGNMQSEKLMDLISFVFQDTFLFNMSIRDNIRIGKPDALEAEIINAAKLAKCHEFIMKTRSGYDTLAGDEGSRLSGGERQRICIARAILKNAPILVLDEATASIDPDSEEQIQEALGELAKGKTLIVIAHRIRTIIGFDKILVLRDGELRAEGKHEELLENSIDYQLLWKAYASTENWIIGAERSSTIC